MSVNFDDLVSLHSEGDDNTGEMTSPLSPTLLQILYCDPAGLTIAQSSPSQRLKSDDDSSSMTIHELHNLTGVHMYHQNNVMIGNFLHPVDRSNSSRPLYNLKSSLLNHTGEGTNNFSMAEIFLSNESARRRSLEQNYESLGTLLADGGIDDLKPPSKDNTSLGDPKTHVVDSSQIESEDFAAAVDPTPWSEIRKKIQSDEESAQVAETSSVQQLAHPHNFNYYPYERHHQLPIPNIVATSKQTTSPSNRRVEKHGDGQSRMEDAVATAAVIASGQKGVTNAGPILPPPSPQVKSCSEPSPHNEALQPPNGVLQPLNGKQKLNARYLQRPLGSYAHSQHSAAHSTNRASVLAAASRKSQYGFGGNHTVPSVPAPPPLTKRKEMITHPTTHRGHISPSNCGAAYERKKQRAKGARVQLNEAIERLSIAMGLAGSQSKQRHEFLSSQIATTANREKTLQTSADCLKLVEQAKKWDRPSFIGAAASIVQGLNAQCEALMRELIILQERLDESSPIYAVDERPDSSTQKRNQCSILDSNVVNVAKRLRPSPQSDDATKLDPSNRRSREHESNIFGLVKDFLDPTSMARSLCVSRTWRDIGAFSDDDAWFNFAVKRFGFYNARQWAEKLEDCGKKVSSMSLYQSMNAANVMPHFEKKNLLFIGDAKIPGRVSGWAFIVERSNGETLRSVRTEPGMLSSTNGSFQSRPVVELRILIQNTGMADQPVIIQNQKLAVDVSTRRTGGELNEIDWDSRFKKVVRTLGGEAMGCAMKQSRYDINGGLCHLQLFDSVMIEVYINARGCSTTSKFQQRSNFTKILVCLEGTTVPMVIPFLRDHFGK